MEPQRPSNESGGHPLQGPHRSDSDDVMAAVLAGMSGKAGARQGDNPDEADEALATLAESGPVTPIRLVMVGSTLAIDLVKSGTVFGRHSDVDVRLPLPDVSRRHCRFFYGQNAWQVIDLNSLNGVHVNGERVTRATLQHADLVKIGGFIFHVEMNDVVRHLRPLGQEAKKHASILQSISQSLPMQTVDQQPKRQAS